MERMSLFSSLKTSIETTIESALDLVLLNHLCLGVHSHWCVITGFPVAFCPRRNTQVWTIWDFLSWPLCYKDSVFREWAAVWNGGNARGRTWWQKGKIRALLKSTQYTNKLSCSSVHLISLITNWNQYLARFLLFSMVSPVSLLFPNWALIDVAFITS